MNWSKRLGIERFIELLMRYMQARGRLLASSLLQRLSILLGVFFFLLLALLFSSYALFLLSLAASVWLNETIQHPVWGYLLVAAFYVLLLVVLCLLFRSSRVQAKVYNFLLAQILFALNDPKASSLKSSKKTEATSSPTEENDDAS